MGKYHWIKVPRDFNSSVLSNQLKSMWTIMVVIYIRNCELSVVGCPLFRLLPTDAHSPSVYVLRQVQGHLYTDARKPKPYEHSNEQCIIRTDGRTDGRTNPKPTRSLGCHHAQADVTSMNGIAEVRISGYKLVVYGEQSQWDFTTINKFLFYITLNFRWFDDLMNCSGLRRFYFQCLIILADW